MPKYIVEVVVESDKPLTEKRVVEIVEAALLTVPTNIAVDSADNGRVGRSIDLAHIESIKVRKNVREE